LYDVPCGGCTACCYKDAVRLLPGDDSFEYETEPHPFMPGELMLAHKPNGDCLYLGDEGCTIHDMKPQMCRDMDCRRIAMAITWTQARKAAAGGMLRMEVWRRGKELLARLERIDREDSLAILGGGYRKSQRRRNAVRWTAGFGGCWYEERRLTCIPALNADKPAHATAVQRTAFRRR
jgi:hypothetical protein